MITKGNAAGLSILKKATGSVKWSTLTELVSRFTQPVITVVLARLLTPEDFGVVGTAMIAISFAQMFWDAGLSKALIQINKEHLDAANVVFWTNFVLGLVIYFLLYVAAPLISDFFNSPESTPVLRVLGLQIIISSLSSVQQALLVRDLDFRRLFWIKLLTAAIPGGFAIPLAVYGYGVWALVAGTLAGQTINLVLLWVYSEWRPTLSYNCALAKKMSRFGIWVMGEGFLAWLIIWGDNLIVGRFFGISDLGLYQTGWMLVSVIFGLVLNPFLPVLFPTFSRLQNDIPSLRHYFLRANRIVMALALPMGVGLLMVGPEMATALFGNKWQGMGLVVSVIGFMFGLAWLVGINTEIYRAMGNPDVNPKLMLIMILFYLPAFLWAAQIGFETFVYVRLLVALLAIPFHIYLACKMLAVSPLYLWHLGKTFFLASFTMGISLSLVKLVIMGFTPSMPPIIFLALLAVLGATIYAYALWHWERSFVVETFNLIRRAAIA